MSARNQARSGRTRGRAAGLEIDLCLADLLERHVETGDPPASGTPAERRAARPRSCPSIPGTEVQVAARRVQDATGRNKLALVGRAGGRVPVLEFLVTGTLERDLPRSGHRGIVVPARERVSDLDVVLHLRGADGDDHRSGSTLCRFWICPAAKSRLGPEPSAAWQRGDFRVHVDVVTAPASGDRIAIQGLRIAVQPVSGD